MDRFNKIKILMLLALIEFFVIPSMNAWAETAYGITYYPGNIPVIISVPHGGTSDTYTGLGYNLGTYDPYYLVMGGAMANGGDLGTIDLADKIRAAFSARFSGATPYVIVNNWYRKYLDTNRDPGYSNREPLLYAADAAEGHSQDQDTIIDSWDALAYVYTGSTNV